jgi:hypothetical protein
VVPQPAERERAASTEPGRSPLLFQDSGDIDPTATTSRVGACEPLVGSFSFTPHPWLTSFASRL